MRARSACACLLLLACVALATGVAGGAGSNLVVTLNVPSSTTLVTTGCPPETAAITSFGAVSPGTLTKTTADCTVSFGSSNDTSSLRMFQSDGYSTAMSNPTDSWTRHTGSSFLYFEADSDPTNATTWAVGANGQVRRSQDGGDTWGSLQTAGGANNTSVSVPTTTVAWIGGDGLDIYSTTTGTNATPSWGAAPVRSGIDVEGLAATSATNVWVVGPNGAIRVTTDGGATAGGWSSRSFTDAAGGPTPTQNGLTGIVSLDANSLVAFGDNGRIVATSDAATWRDISLPSGIMVEDVEIISDTTLVAVGEAGRVYTTSNATNATPTWNLRYDDSMFEYRAVDFLNANVGVAVGEEGILLRTSDGGANWARETVDTSIAMEGVRFTSATAIVAVGTSGTILRSVDAGASWDFEIATNVSFEDVSATTQGIVWRVGSDGVIERSTTLGTTWTAQTSNTASDLFGVRAFSPTEAVAVGRDGAIVRTVDGGSTWTTRSSGTTTELRAIDAYGSLTMAVGADGSIIRSWDRGATWSVSRPASGAMLLDVEVSSSSIAVASGANGTLYRTIDGGGSWSTVAGLPTGSTLIQSVASDSASGHLFYLSGSSVARSTDGGATWSLRSTTLRYSDVGTISATHLVAVAAGYLRQSTDAGATWTAMSGTQVTYHDARSVDVRDSSTSIAVGSGGLSASTGQSGIVPDYQFGVTDWISDGTEAFGACLRATSAVATWTPHATCDQSADGAHWRAIPTVADGTAEVASTGIGDGVRVADLRFGLRVALDEPPGELSAGITFLVVAPDV